MCMNKSLMSVTEAIVCCHVEKKCNEMVKAVVMNDAVPSEIVSSAGYEILKLGTIAWMIGCDSLRVSFASV